MIKWQIREKKLLGYGVPIYEISPKSLSILDFFELLVPTDEMCILQNKQASVPKSATVRPI